MELYDNDVKLTASAQRRLDNCFTKMHHALRDSDQANYADKIRDFAYILTICGRSSPPNSDAVSNSLMTYTQHDPYFEARHEGFESNWKEKWGEITRQLRAYNTLHSLGNANKIPALEAAKAHCVVNDNGLRIDPSGNFDTGNPFKTMFNVIADKEILGFTSWQNKLDDFVGLIKKVKAQKGEISDLVDRVASGVIRKRYFEARNTALDMLDSHGPLQLLADCYDFLDWLDEVHFDNTKANSKFPDRWDEIKRRVNPSAGKGSLNGYDYEALTPWKTLR